MSSLCDPPLKNPGYAPVHKGDVRYTTNMLRFYVTADYFSARNAEPAPGLKCSVPALIEQEGWMFTGFWIKEAEISLNCDKLLGNNNNFFYYLRDR